MICVMIGYSNWSERPCQVIKHPKVVTDEGEQMLSVTTERKLA